jgi:hypothetical protein
MYQSFPKAPAEVFAICMHCYSWPISTSNGLKGTIEKWLWVTVGFKVYEGFGVLSSVFVPYFTLIAVRGPKAPGDLFPKIN